MNRAEIRTVDGEVIAVEGALSEVEKELSDAARSGSSRFAWLTDLDSGERIGVNPTTSSASGRSTATNEYQPG